MAAVLRPWAVVLPVNFLDPLWLVYVASAIVVIVLFLWSYGREGLRRKIRNRSRRVDHFAPAGVGIE